MLSRSELNWWLLYGKWIFVSGDVVWGSLNMLRRPLLSHAVKIMGLLYQRLLVGRKLVLRFLNWVIMLRHWPTPALSIKGSLHISRLRMEATHGWKAAWY